MICKLCLQEKKLIGKSHIIPKFMYKDLFDEKHFIHSLNLDTLEPNKKLPDGIYERNILCSNCDNVVLGRLENYASKIIYGSNGGLAQNEYPKFEYRKSINENELKSILISNIDYTKFKLFLLSILLRAHFSKHDFFREIDLGIYADKIRKMILDGDAGEEHILETSLFYLKTNDVLAKSIAMPRYLKQKGNSSYIFSINKILYFFNLSQTNKHPLVEKGHITKDDLMEVAVLTGEFANSFFDSFLGKKIRLRNRY